MSKTAITRRNSPRWARFPPPLFTPNHPLLEIDLMAI